MGWSSFEMVGVANRPIALDAILNNRPMSVKLPDYKSGARYIITPIEHPHLSRTSKFANIVTKKFSNVEWLVMELSTATYTSLTRRNAIMAMVAKIPTDRGLVIAFRNGWNMSQYNFAIWHKDHWHFRSNAADTVEWIEMLLAPIEQMPLFIHSECKKHREFAIKMLTIPWN
jgi:hypothetical protein